MGAIDQTSLLVNVASATNVYNMQDLKLIFKAVFVNNSVSTDSQAKPSVTGSLQRFNIALGWFLNKAKYSRFDARLCCLVHAVDRFHSGF